MSRKNPESSSTRQFLVVSLVSLLVISCLPTKTHTKTHAHAVDPVILNDREDEYPLGLHLEILNDPARQFSIEEVASPEFDGKFIRNKTKEINPGLVNSAYWIRFQVNSQAPQTGEWWLEVAGYEIDASLYYPRPDGSPGFEVKHAGKTRPAAGANRTLHYYPAFPLPLAPGSEQTIYLRVDGKRLNFSMTLWSGTGFIRESQKDFVILGLYWGVLLIMAGYNFFLFLALRDRSYLYYVLFLIFALSALVLRKVQIHLDLYAFLNPIATLMIVFLLRFSVTFLMAKVNAPRLGRILNGLQIGLVATGLLQIVLSGAILFHWIWFALVLSGFVAIFITSLVTWRRGYRPARYFVLAQTMLLVTFFFDLLGQLGYAPSISEYTSPAGVSLMAVLMSLALADRINIFRREHEKAELETRQRNRELVLLNQVITATTTELEFETVSRELGRAFSLTHAILVLADEKNSAIKIAADYHTGDGPSTLGQSFPVKGDPLLEHISYNKASLIVEDAQNDTRTISIREHFRLQNTTTLLLFPLVAGNEIIGGFILGSDKPGRFSADELRLMQSVAEQMVGAIIRIRLAEERKQLEEQYHQSQKMEAIGCLAGGIAHDFNNLLTPIIGYMDMLMTELPPVHEIYPDLEKVLKAATQAATLTQQILAFSRKQMLEVKSVDLNDIITEFNKMLCRLIGENIDLQLFLDSSLNPVKADRSQIEQVLLNLAVNARDAMSPGGKLVIETSNVFLDEKYAENHSEVIAGPYVMMAVSDNGCGMDDETKHRIFEPFFTTKEQGSGTGLGLATVHGIVKQHRGHIWVYSEHEKGTTFKIYLPWTDEQVQTEQPVSRHASQGGTETVLVVEDEEGVRDLVSETLEKYGYKVLIADNPEQGLKIASSYSSGIDLLLTDVIMPEMNGQELYRQLHMNTVYSDTKVLYISGYTYNMIVRDGILEEGTNYLQKPFSIQKLTQKVRDVLDG